MSERPDWLTYFDTIARAVSARGDCTRAQVGAVITTHDHYIIATGYNGFPSSHPGCHDEEGAACLRGVMSRSSDPAVRREAEDMHCWATHAENNAINTALALEHARLLQGATMYVTRLPCRRCSERARLWGITTIYAEGRRITL